MGLLLSSTAAGQPLQLYVAVCVVSRHSHMNSGCKHCEWLASWAVGNGDLGQHNVNCTNVDATVPGQAGSEKTTQQQEWRRFWAQFLNNSTGCVS